MPKLIRMLCSNGCVAFAIRNRFLWPNCSKKLEIQLSINTELPPDPESVVCSYFEAIIKWEWQGLISFTHNDLALEGCPERYTELVYQNHILKKIKNFAIVNSGTSEDKNIAFVYLELNHKYPWTVILSKRHEKWKLRQHLNGDPTLYYAQNQIYNELAKPLGEGNFTGLEQKFAHAFNLYPDSADLYYYQGLWYQGEKLFPQAKVNFFNAISLDNYWTAPFYHLALLNLQDKNFPEALYWLEKQHFLEPDDPRTLNNVAACHLHLGDRAKARQIWEEMLLKFPDFNIARENLSKLDQNV